MKIEEGDSTSAAWFLTLFSCRFSRLRSSPLAVPRALVCALGLAASAGGGGASGATATPPGPSSESSSKALTYFTQDDINRGAKRAGQSRALWAASLVWSLLVLTALAHPRIARAFVSAASRLAGSGDGASAWRVYVATALAVALIAGAYIVLRMPFAWARGYFLEHAWGLSTQGAGAFFVDWLKSAVITVVLYTLALAGVVALRAKLPAFWPLAAWGAVSALVALMVFLHPVVIAPLCNRFESVKNPELRARAERIADRAGITVSDVLWIDASRRTTRTNAYFTGLGATKRIVLFDTLRGEAPAADTTPAHTPAAIPPEVMDEIETVLAHEAGHWRGGHMWKGTLLALAGMAAFFLALWLVSKGPVMSKPRAILNSPSTRGPRPLAQDPIRLAPRGARGASKGGWSWVPGAALPGGARAAAGMLFVAMVLNVLAMPVANAISRTWEREADRAAFELSEKPEAFIRAEVGLVRKNIAEIEPGAWTVFLFHSHPPPLERIRAAEAFRVRHQE